MAKNLEFVRWEEMRDLRPLSEAEEIAAKIDFFAWLDSDPKVRAICEGDDVPQEIKDNIAAWRKAVEIMQKEKPSEANDE